MKRGEVIENLEMVDIATNGKAVGKHEGRVIFVDKLVPGDVATVEVYKKKKSYAEASYKEIQTFSPLRVEPKCAHFGLCGGCKWQNLDYAEQLKFKQNQVEQNLKKFSGMELPKILPILGESQIYQYRNKLEYTFSNKRWLTPDEIQNEDQITERNALGFHMPGRFDKVLDINECHLQDDITNQIRNFVKARSLEMEIPFFDLREQTGIMRNMIVRTTSTREVMVVLIVTQLTKEVQDLLKELMVKFSNITSLNYMINDKKNDSIYDLDFHNYAGKDHIVEKMFHLNYKIGPKSFYQTNSKQAERLYAIVDDFAELKGSELVYDLYTGTGTIANFLATKCAKVIGIETVAEAIQDAIENANANGIENSSFHVGDMRVVLNEEFFSQHGRPDVIITDPPRAGMHEDVVHSIANSGAKTIVYVSCNPATQARDLAMLNAVYRMEKVQPVDMFPHTSHVENVVKLVRITS